MEQTPRPRTGNTGCINKAKKIHLGGSHSVTNKCISLGGQGLINGRPQRSIKGLSLADRMCCLYTRLGGSKVRTTAEIVVKSRVAPLYKFNAFNLMPMDQAWSMADKAKSRQEL